MPETTVFVMVLIAFGLGGAVGCITMLFGLNAGHRLSTGRSPVPQLDAKVISRVQVTKKPEPAKNPGLNKL